MGKQYAFDTVTPDMKGGINFWAKQLGMGAANIRTAIRAKSLKAELVVLNPEGNPDLKGYQITGQDILDWRANQKHATAGEGKTVRSTTHFVYKTSAKITAEQAEAANAALTAAGIEFQLVKPAINKASKTQKPAKQADETNLPMPEVLTDDAEARLAALSEPIAENEQPVEAAPVPTRGFGFGRKSK